MVYAEGIDGILNQSREYTYEYVYETDDRCIYIYAC